PAGGTEAVTHLGGGHMREGKAQRPFHAGAAAFVDVDEGEGFAQQDLTVPEGPHLPSETVQRTHTTHSARRALLQPKRLYNRPFPRLPQPLSHFATPLPLRLCIAAIC